MTGSVREGGETLKVPLLVADAGQDLETAIARAEILGKALTRAAEGRLTVEVQAFGVGGSLADADIDPELERDHLPLLIIATGTEVYRRARAAAVRLRTEQCVWSAIHMFTDSSDATPDIDEEWNIRTHELPPENLHTVIRAIETASPVARGKRPWFVAQAFRNLADKIDRTIDPSDAADSTARPFVLAAELEIVSEALESYRSTDRIDDFCLELARVASNRTVDSPRVDSLLDSIAGIESKGAHVSLTVRSIMHGLKNKILLSRWRPSRSENAESMVSSRSQQLLLHGCASLPVPIAADVEKILAGIRENLERGDPGKADTLALHARDLRIAARRLLEHVEVSGAAEASRIVIIEDDADWSRRLAEFIQAIPMPRPVVVQQAASVSEGRQLLKAHGAAIVLLDLGLPLGPGGSPLPDAGMSLLEEFARPHPSGRIPEHTFLILTAGESFGAAIRKALDLGISASGYLRKGSKALETELEARIHAALRPGRSVRIDLFEAAPRLVHIDNHEVTLDLPVWSLLMTLASARRTWLSPVRISERLAMPPYSLDPESRGGEGTDPSERIERQLPKYRSELNLKLIETYRKIRGQFPPEVLVEFDDELGYRLNASARMLTTLPYVAPDHRPRVLVVEDTLEWSDRIATTLERHGFETVVARTLVAARSLALDPHIDLMTLDLELPENDETLEQGLTEPDGGLRLLQWLGQSGRDLPVVLLTATSPRDCTILPLLTAGLRYDDYLFKEDVDPINRLLASIERLWREVLANCRILDWIPTAKPHSIWIDTQTQLLKAVGGYAVKASGLGEVVLQLLSSRPNAFVGRWEIIERLFPDPETEPDNPERALDQHIKRLRKTITRQTKGMIDGRDVIWGSRAIYCLRGIVQRHDP